MTTKKDIRKHFLELRLNMPDAEAAELNNQLLQQVQLLTLSEIRIAHIFLPISEKKEVDTWPMVKWFREHYPEIEWTISRSDMQSGDMQHFLWKTNTVLVKNKFGIPEPASGELIEPSEIDLVFVPMLAFDLHGHRIGYGKGMYDRFLHQCKPEVKTVGLSIFEPVTEIKDIEPWDIPLHSVVTPTQIYQFK
ncbi:5-formyltetrahydrofolate cyclo-ligase [Chitinophaga silvatica]|uniref:5-formyltetrahydrofolate cyclo-ligase n=1 Tax=Chitinophaga silvatica TaxID=2282649 RepID=A0A3E1Y4G5_9BACT|nr:5-formyltetrahydrofolate cyclo-ligase [Chitinophaga silvatica]RFS19536.1 5-formyltetrahydrofolate cyclo-ligase [Chitinophaga silvatica]